MCLFSGLHVGNGRVAKDIVCKRSRSRGTTKRWNRAGKVRRYAWMRVFWKWHVSTVRSVGGSRMMCLWHLADIRPRGRSVSVFQT